MTIGMFIEPEECYQRRLLEERQRREQEARQRLASMNDLTTELIFDALRERGDEPVRITTVVNWVAKRLNYSVNAERIAAKKRLLKMIGWFIKIGRLERVRRNFACIPETDERHQAFLAAQEQKIKSLPEPNL